MAVKVPRWTGPLTLVATPESGAITVGERTMLKKVFEGTYANCFSGLLARGYFGTGSMAGWVVASSQVDPQKGARGKLTISWEPGGSAAYIALPCDDFRIEPIELYPKIERNAIFNQTSTGTGGSPDITTQMVALAYGALHGGTLPARQTAEQAVSNYADTELSDMGKVLLDKLRKGEETFYMAGMKFIWWYFRYTMPNLSLGGIIQWPSGPGNIPSYLPSDLGFLRLADSVEPVGVNGSMYKVIGTWIGGPKGHWDNDIYPSA